MGHSSDSTNGRQIEDLAETLADDRPIDWDSTLGFLPPGPQLDALRLIEKISQTYRRSSPPEEPAPAFTWGHLLVYELLGSGGFGEVYRARDPRLAREVALKLRRPATEEAPGARAFLSEARRLARVRHPNVLTIYGADVHDDRAGFWTDLVHGSTLEARLRADGPLSAEETVRVVSQVCRALAAVHAAGIIHGDVTCANVMVDDAGRALLTDFGSVSEHGSILSGTPLYMAPELFRGEPPTRSCDLYSLGVLLFRALTARYPIEATKVDELMQHHAQGAAFGARAAEPALDAWVAEIIDGLLSRTPAERPDGALDVARALEGPRAVPHNLPASVTRFVGRETLRENVLGRLAGERLVTLTGIGGCGKTRLAIEVAGRALRQHPGGAWLIELAPVGDPGLVVFAIGRALGVSESAERGLMGALIEHLSAQPTLLVLDNCEHVLDACREVADALLRRAPTVRILATSREPLGVAGETRIPVPPLGLPKGGTPEELLLSESVGLFVDRARSVRHDFTLTAENAPAVLEICRRLDGIPLAIELAVARLRALSEQEIAARLDDRFRFLTRGDRTALPRHRTLAALLDWSYALLEEEERLLLRRLSVFAGGWTLDAAEAVCAGEGLEEPDILDVMTRLVDRSLIEPAVDHAIGSTRYRMLESIQAYANGLLEPAARANVQKLHRAYFLALAERLEPELRGPDQVKTLARLESDLENFRVAAELRADEGTPTEETVEERVRLVGTLALFFDLRGHWSMARQVGRSLLARRKESDRSAPWAKLFLGHANLAMRAADYDDAKVHCTEALALYRGLGDERHECLCLNNLGAIALYQGDRDRARQLWESALALSRRATNPALEIHLLTNLGLAAGEDGKLAEARAYLEPGIERARSLGDPAVLSLALINLGTVAREEGRLEEAKRLIEESAEIGRQLGDRNLSAISLLTLGGILARLGKTDEAEALVRGSLAVFREIANPHNAVGAIEEVAQLALMQTDHERAVRLFGAARAIRESIGVPTSPLDAESFARDLEKAREALGEERFASAWTNGSGLTFEQGIAVALRELP